MIIKWMKITIPPAPATVIVVRPAAIWWRGGIIKWVKINPPGLRHYIEVRAGCG